MLPSPATKAAAISDYLAGKGGYFKIANEYGISPFTLKKWVESPEKALNQSSQKGIIELESSKSDYTGLIERNELESEEPEFKTKDAEIRYLRDKVAYLETLSELMGYNLIRLLKKKIRMHFPSSQLRTMFQRHPSLLNRRSLKEVLLRIPQRTRKSKSGCRIDTAYWINSNTARLYSWL